MSEKSILVYRSKVKEAATAAGVNRLSSGFVEALSDKVEELVRQAATRALENGRATLRPCDL